MPNPISILTGYWFLPVLFLVSVYSFLLSQIINMGSNKNLMIVMLADMMLIVLSQYMNEYDIGLNYIKIVPMAFLFFLLGNIFYRNKTNVEAFIQSLRKKNPYIVEFVVMMCCIFFFIAVDINSPVAMYNNEYGNYFLFAFTAIIGSAGVWIIAGWLKDSSFLSWCGRNSIVIYVWQFVVCTICRAVMMRLTTFVLPERSELVWFLTASMVAILCVIPIVLFSDRFIPWIYGKNNFSKRVDKNE